MLPPALSKLIPKTFNNASGALPSGLFAPRNISIPMPGVSLPSTAQPCTLKVSKLKTPCPL